MGFFSGNTESMPLPEQKPLGLDKDRLATNEQARPVPVWWGTQRLGVTFLSQPFDQEADPVEREVGKDSQTVGYNYYCSFAALVGQGPVDKLLAIYLDGEKVGDYPNHTRATYPTSVALDLTVAGTLVHWTWYWGTATQGIDPALAALATGAVVAPNVAEDHPAYRGQCYFVAIAHLLGYGRTSVQQIEIVAGRWPTVADLPWWPADVAIDLQGDCNPIACVADLLTHPRYGLGLAHSRLDTTGLADVARQLAGEGLGISPKLTETDDIRRQLITLLEYFGGYVYTTRSGLISVGLARPVPYGAAIPELDEAHLSERPRLTAPGWDDTLNRVYVNFTNRHNEYAGDSVSADAAANFAARGESATTVLERRWFTRPELADWVARLTAIERSAPHPSGSFKMPRSKCDAAGLDVGSAFKLSWRHLRLNRLYARVTALGMPDATVPEVEIEFQGIAPKLDGVIYTPPTYAPPTVAVIEPVQTDYVRLVEMPYTKAGKDAPWMAVLVARKSRSTDGFFVHREKSPGSYGVLNLLRSFAVRATLRAGINAAATSLGLDIPGDATDTEVTAAAADSEAQADRYLALLIDANGNQEILSLRSATLAAARQWNVTAYRGRMDTVPLAWSAGAEAWVIPAATLGAVLVPIATPNADGTASNWKVQPSTRSKVVDIATCPSYAITLRERAARPWAPDGVTVSPATTSSWQTFTVSWTPRYADANAPTFPGVYWRIQARKATDPVSAYATVYDRVRYEDASVGVQSGLWQTVLGSTCVTFVVRVVGVSGSKVSLFSQEFTVTKV
jgi:hypothetical protein